MTSFDKYRIDLVSFLLLIKNTLVLFLAVGLSHRRAPLRVLGEVQD